MKFNPLYLLGGLFVLCIAALGALLLRPFGSDPRVLQPFRKRCRTLDNGKRRANVPVAASKSQTAKA